MFVRITCTLIVLAALAPATYAQGKKQADRAVRVGQVVKVLEKHSAIVMRSNNNGEVRVELGRQPVTIDGRKARLEDVQSGDEIVARGQWKKDLSVLNAAEPIRIRRNGKSASAPPQAPPAPQYPPVADPSPQDHLVKECPFPELRKHYKAAITGTVQRVLDVVTPEGKYFVVELEDPRTQRSYRVEFHERSIALAWEAQYRWPLDRKHNMILGASSVFTGDYYLKKGSFIQVVGESQSYEQSGRTVFSGYWIDLDPSTR